jgi:hypothetical protein
MRVSDGLGTGTVTSLHLKWHLHERSKFVLSFWKAPVPEHRAVFFQALEYDTIISIRMAFIGQRYPVVREEPG